MVFFIFLWVVVEALASDAHTVARSVRHGRGQGGQFTYRHTLRRLALLSLTRSALAALPSEVSLSQQREQSAPWTPLLLAPHAWQVSGCQGVPAFWRAYQRRWRSALVGSGIVDLTGLHVDYRGLLGAVGGFYLNQGDSISQRHGAGMRCKRIGPDGEPMALGSTEHSLEKAISAFLALLWRVG
jgi:hypothetical protein